jgi:hypothetical protein
MTGSARTALTILNLVSPREDMMPTESRKFLLRLADAHLIEGEGQVDREERPPLRVHIECRAETAFLPNMQCKSSRRSSGLHLHPSLSQGCCAPPKRCVSLNRGYPSTNGWYLGRHSTYNPNEITPAPRATKASTRHNITL